MLVSVKNDGHSAMHIARVKCFLHTEGKGNDNVVAFPIYVSIHIRS